MKHGLTHAQRALRNAFYSRGRRLFGLGFSLDYLRFAWRASRQMDYTGPGSLELVGFRVDYWNQSHALFLLHEIFVNAEYEFRSSAARPRIVDCGANIGMAILFFKALCPEADVLAFEPDPVTFSGLTRTIQSNRLASVVAERAAVTEQGGTVRLYRNRSDPGSIVASIDQAWGGDASEEVPAVRLSDRITTTVDFLKLDVEGAEYGIVRDLVTSGAIRWIREAVIEYHQTADRPHAQLEMTSALRGAGFDLWITPSNDILPTGLIRARRAADAAPSLRDTSGDDSEEVSGH